MEWFCPDCYCFTSNPEADGCYHEIEDDPKSDWMCPGCDVALRKAMDGTEYMEEPWESPEIVHPGVDDPDKVPMLRAKYPHATTWELCGFCQSEVVIPAYQESKCPVCGEPIIPCSMCCREDGYMTCHDKCPYSKEEN